MSRPGDGLVVRAAAPGRLTVHVKPLAENGSVAATVRIEPLTQSVAAREPQMKASPEISRTSRDLRDFRVLAHVASIGDVAARAEQWLAGPSAPSRIEGLSIEWPGKPDDLDICYSVKTARAQAVSGQIMQSGGFAGTRGKAVPLVGVMMEMSGPGAAHFQFVAEAIFLGAPAMRLTGKRVVLSGPTGREPLVGLRLSVQELDVERPSEPRLTPIRPARASSRVRVFRSSVQHDHLAASS
ncbi:hypothetical protein [Methylocapsa sp. S129]|uniref:hypothetical protein n=1 Tax=Methylocapsa sp. S129 TaxID=1641869 RepID=UPI00131CA176|nr:hypothetical protein [Methylocapsa sp. S129]